MREILDRLDEARRNTKDAMATATVLQDDAGDDQAQAIKAQAADVHARAWEIAHLVAQQPDFSTTDPSWVKSVAAIIRRMRKDHEEDQANAAEYDEEHVSTEFRVTPELVLQALAEFWETEAPVSDFFTHLDRHGRQFPETEVSPLIDRLKAQQALEGHVERCGGLGNLEGMTASMEALRQFFETTDFIGSFEIGYEVQTSNFLMALVERGIPLCLSITTYLGKL